MRKGQTKQICIHGHDTFVCGRYKGGACIECTTQKNLTHRIDPSKDSRFKQVCPQGHDTTIVGRDTNSMCIECKRIKAVEFYEKNIEQIRIKQKIYERLNKKKIYERKKKWLKEHKAQRQKYIQEYYDKNKDRILQINKAWRDANPDICSLLYLEKDQERKLRIPRFGQKGIATFYKNKPLGMTVDHYIPLQGDLVSGLHVVWNLQYLTQPQNSSKKNKINLNGASEWYGKLLEEAGLKWILEVNNNGK